MDEHIDNNIDGKIEITDITPDTEFNNNNPIVSVNNLQLQEWDKQMISDLFHDYGDFYLQWIPCTIWFCYKGQIMMTYTHVVTVLNPWCDVI